MGADERNQFQVMEDLPGGLARLANVVALFHERGVVVGLPYNPWDTDTARPNVTDEQAMAQIGGTVAFDWINGDTMSYMNATFFTDSVMNGNPLALQPEGGPSTSSLNWTHMGWGYWDASFIPAVDTWKWLTIAVTDHPHMTHICDRWSQNHTTDLQQAWFNGIGFVSWENVWGIWMGMSQRDAEATRRVSAMSRYFSGFLTAAGWEPHTVLHPDACGVGVFASRWPQPVSVVYPNNATLWTIVNRGSLNYTGPVVYVSCSSSGVSYYDVYRGVSLSPTLVPGESDTCALSLPVEAEGFSGVLAIATADVSANLTSFLQTMSKMTTISLGSLSQATSWLPQVMTQWDATTPASSTPPDMVYLPGNASWSFAVSGTEIEGGWVAEPNGQGVDVQYPWESVCMQVHRPHVLSVLPLYMDVTPVTNGQYAAFLAASGYVPRDLHNFLRDWSCTGSSCEYPSGWDAKPVTWVDLLDSSAYCTFNGKRLPNDWEWQYAAQGSNVDYLYPWGTTFDASRVPGQSHGAVRPAPPDVGSYPSGASLQGVQDLMGLVWQWTNEFKDDHTRSGLVRGGAWYRSESSTWYFPGNLSSSAHHPVLANTHNKLLLMWPSYDRHGTVGFRCVMDAEQ
jgi:formylglycine-generating enzyme required for sulfatase activity